MKNTIRMISVLTIVGLISGAALSFMYKYAHPLILDNQENRTEKAIFKIFPDAKSYDKETMEKGEILFKMKNKNGSFLGYAFLAEGNGYQGTVKLMAGIAPDLETLVGIEVLESQETPGLGQEITTDEFKKQFKGLKALPEIAYVKNAKPENPNEIEAITGATVSSGAVVSILNKKIKEIRKYEKRL